MKEISLIICTLNRDEMIADVLESADKQTLGKENFEVLIIDQSDNDKTKALAEKYPDFRYIRLSSKGASVSRNEGIKQSNGKILVYVDDDVLFDENYLLEISEFFKNSDLKPDMVGGKTIVKFLGDKPEWLEGPLMGILAHSDYGDEPFIFNAHPKHVPYTCNMAIKKECAEAAGGFSVFISNIEQKFPINEDVMFAHEVKNKGFNLVYNPKMFVYHRMPAKRLTYDYYKSKYYSHGKSDAFLYYMLKMFKKKDIPLKIFVCAKRILESLILKHFQKNLPDKYYQRLRLYYNSGFISALLKILQKNI